MLNDYCPARTLVGLWEVGRELADHLVTGITFPTSAVTDAENISGLRLQW